MQMVLKGDKTPNNTKSERARVWRVTWNFLEERANGERPNAVSPLNPAYGDGQKGFYDSTDEQLGPRLVVKGMKAGLLVYYRKNSHLSIIRL